MDLHWIDAAIITSYACAMLGLGWSYSHRQNSDEYFVGSRAMNPLLIGVSMFATLFSTISYLSTPSEIMEHGPVVLTSVLAIPIAYYIVGHLMVPVYMRHRVTIYVGDYQSAGQRARRLACRLAVQSEQRWSRQSTLS